MCSREFKLNIITVKCDSCKGSGVNKLNDFSSEIVTEYEDVCFHCNGSGYNDVAEKVVIHCNECEKDQAMEKFWFKEWISEEDKKSITENGYIEGLCDECNIGITYDMYDGEYEYLQDMRSDINA